MQGNSESCASESYASENALTPSPSPIKGEGRMESYAATDKRLLDNFMAGYRKPFSAEIMAELTGVSLAAVRKRIKQGVAEGEVREIETGIYGVKRNDTVISCWDWTYSRSAAEAVLRAVKSGEGRSIRRIAREMGYSRQYVFKYLEALASIGALAWDGERYICTGQGDMLRLGGKIEKGILNRIKREGK